MIVATNLKNGTTFLFEDKPSQVIKYSHTKMGRGTATVKVIMKSLETGKLLNKTFPSTAKFEEISTNKKSLQYLYRDDANAIFMNPINFSQVEVDIDLIEDQLQFIKEGETIDIVFWEDNAIAIELAPKITLKVVTTDPGVKGNSSTNVFKPATLENGLDTKVPLFIKKGDYIKIDTKTGEYVERDTSEKSNRETQL